jgi:hypothetical protein
VTATLPPVMCGPRRQATPLIVKGSQIWWRNKWWTVLAITPCPVDGHDQPCTWFSLSNRADLHLPLWAEPFTRHPVWAER